MTDDKNPRAEGEPSAAPASTTKPAAKPVLTAKKPVAKPLAPVAAVHHPVKATAVPLIRGVGDYVPHVDSEGLLHLSPQFFTDAHVSGLSGSYPVRRFAGAARPPYVSLPGDSGVVAIRTGVVITGKFDDFVPKLAVMGEGMVVDIETRHGELYLLVRPFGAGVATVIEGVSLAVIEVTYD